jgi:hypothetical protein
MSDSVKKFHEDLEHLVKKHEDMTKNSELYPYRLDKPTTETQWYSDTTFPDKKDKYVQAVKERFEQRSQTGIKKYNTTLERDDLNLQDWLLHLQEELMDATLYIERLKEEVGN